MLFTFKTYKEYLEAYTYLLRVNESFNYTRIDNQIQVFNPDEELINKLTEIKDGPKPTYTLI